MKMAFTTRGFVALISMLVVSAVLMGFAIARAATALSAREDALLYEQVLQASERERGYAALSALAAEEGQRASGTPP